MVCPNKRLKAWKDLVKIVGEDKAYLLWGRHQGNVPQQYYNEQSINESATSVAGSNISEENLFQSTVDFNDLIGSTSESIFTDNFENKSIDSDLGKITDILFNGNTGNLNVDNILNNIISNVPNITEHTAEILKRSRNLLGKSKVKVSLVPESEMQSNQTVMQYDSNSNTIQISLDRINSFDSKVATVAFLHEMTHSLTVQALAKEPSKRTFAEQELADVVQNFLKKYKNSTLADEYGFKDEFEFVAEFYANPEFRDAVKAESDAWWRKIVEAIRRLFEVAQNPEYTKLFNTIINFVEGDYQDYDGIKHFDRVFAKEVEYKKPELVTFQDKLDRLSGKAIDNIAQARARTAASKKAKSKKDQKAHLKNIDDLIEEMDKLSEINKLQVIAQYTNTLAKTIYQIDNGMKRLYTKTKDFRKDDLLPLLQSYEEYLLAYDLTNEINELLAASRRELKVLSEEDQKSLDEIRKTLSYAVSRRDELVKEFVDLKREQGVKVFSRPEYNTQVETDFRNKLYKEHSELKIQGESRDQYVSRMLATRDKEEYENALIASAEKMINNPSLDISSFKAKFSDHLNISSKLIQIITNITSAVREKITSQYKDYDLMLNDLFKDFIKEKGNKKPSEAFKNIYEQDKDGNYFFKGVYSIKFRDIYLEEYIPLKQALSEITEKLKLQGLSKVEYITNDEYKQADADAKAWMKKHTLKDHDDPTGKAWYPRPIYKNAEVTGMDKQVLKEAIALAKLGHKEFKGKRSLIRKTGKTQFYKFPAITKSNFERAIEMDAKGIVEDIKSDLTEIRPDDIGYGEPVSKTGESLKNIKVHFRGDLSPDQQSLDVLSLLRKEYLNVISYKEKSKEEATILLVADISKSKEYLQISKKTGLPLLNAFNKNEPVETMSGEFTNEYLKIKGIIERTVYDTFHEHGGNFSGVDVNKITSYVNGMTATIAMSFDIASGTANVLNGFTQLFIESVGGDVFSTKSLLKAEAKYTSDMPNILRDLSSPVKTSFTNQLLEMYDVFGGFDPATQEFIRNSIAKKLASKQTLNGLNEMGEHAMNSVVTMSVLDGLKVMNVDHKYIDKDGNVVDSESKAASLLDMLVFNDKGKLVMSDSVKFTKQNLTVDYHKGGKVHVNLLIKNKIFDVFGVYDNNFKNEFSKTVLGKLTMMFKNFFLSAAQYRFTGIQTSLKSKEDLTDDELNYNTAKKEYTEGTYVTLIRYFKEAVIPALKNLELMYVKDVYNGLSDHEKANLKKVTIEVMLTSIIVPAIGALLASAAGPDDDETWFMVYQLRRLESELSQFRNPIEAGKIITNPIAAVRLLQHGLSFAYEVATPLDFAPDKGDNFFSYLNEDSKHQNILLKKGKKIVPIWSKMDRDYKQLYSLINK